MTGLEAFVVPLLTGAGASASTAATVGTAANVIGAAATLGSTVAGYTGAQAAGKAQAEEARRRGNEERVSAQLKAKQEMKKKEQLLSRQRAQFGASGAGTEGSAATIIADTEAQGNYNSELELWQGENRAAGFEDQANMALFENKQRRTALPFTLGSQVITGGASLMKSRGASFGGDTISEDYDPESGWRTTTRKASPYRYG